MRCQFDFGCWCFGFVLGLEMVSSAIWVRVCCFAEFAVCRVYVTCCALTSVLVVVLGLCFNCGVIALVLRGFCALVAPGLWFWCLCCDSLGLLLWGRCLWVVLGAGFQGLFLGLCLGSEG